mmetsp:Transcript_22629/g.21796  ORF Transcript_22629/g.21796 Transcript_22629/m.21796 type:complete len:209 (-) Transcript_22629:3080-3706(-)
MLVVDLLCSVVREVFYLNLHKNNQHIDKYLLKNEFINDFVHNNENSQFLLDQNFKNVVNKFPGYLPLSSQPEEGLLQEFFINHKVQGKYFTVEPKGTHIIKDAIIYYPMSLKQNQSQMTLLVRNNLTIFYPIELKGSAGTGIIEFISSSKKPLNTTLEERHFPDREKILSFIYGQDWKEEKVHPEAPILFSVSTEDMLQFDEELEQEL